MSTLEKDLQNALEGEICFDTAVRRVYSVDASIYEIPPIGVVWPRNRSDVIKALQIAEAHDTAVIPRGAATGIVGGCIGEGLVLDCSKYLNTIHHIDIEQENVLCDPGVIQDDLNAALAPHGYRLGPDTSTGNRATLGGMVANNSAGAYSLKYGRTSDHILEAELVLAGGEVLYLGATDDVVWKAKESLHSSEGRIYRELARLKNELSEEIRRYFPPLPRRASGYNFDELIKPGPFNICKIIAGSEGSFGILTRLRMRIVPKPRYTGLCALHFKDLIDAFEHIPSLLSEKPLALEVMDEQVIEMGRLSPSMRHKLGWLHGQPKAILIMAFEANTESELSERLAVFGKVVEQHAIAYAHTLITDPEAMAHVWALRKSGLGLLLSRRSHSRAIAFMEDLAVPPENLASLMRAIRQLFAKYDSDAGVYGHAGAGCIHIRPYIDLGKTQDLQKMKAMMEEVADIVLSLKGALSGEHGDGYTRSWLNEKMFGDPIYQGFASLKRAFDPRCLMNPGKVVASQGFLDNLRLNPDTQRQKISTVFDFSKEGGFELSVDLCNGNAQCRKPQGTMCPSFQATQDERHSTRARAQALRGIINGKDPLEGLTQSELYQIMELCLECKGCKTECPSQVDMARIKAEFLHHYHTKAPFSLRRHLMGNIATVNRIGSAFAPFSNWMLKLPLNRFILKTLGITPERSLPPFAFQRFSSWLKKHHNPEQGAHSVVLFNDTYTEYNYPNIGKAALHVLRQLNCRVHIPPWQCCGRPLISKGLLTQAKKRAKALVDTLYPLARSGLPIIGLEPSCILTLKDDYPSLVPGGKARVIADACIPLDSFLNHLISKELFPSFPGHETIPVLVHGHCHQKSLIGMEDTMELLSKIPTVKASLIPSGCCGVAGSFGYEKEHYALSQTIGELSLLPHIRQAPTKSTIIANGLSCRSQITHNTTHSPKHLAEFLAHFFP